MTYDEWKTMSPEDEAEERERREQQRIWREEYWERRGEEKWEEQR